MHVSEYVTVLVFGIVSIVVGSLYSGFLIFFGLCCLALALGQWVDQGWD